MKIVYIAHPLGSGPEREANRVKAAKWVAWAASKGVAPVADWIILSGFWEETPELRARGLAIDVALVQRCDEVWLCGNRISAGMQIEADAAKAAGILVWDLTKDIDPLAEAERIVGEAIASRVRAYPTREERESMG